MPNNYINSLSAKYGIDTKELENDWSDAEKMVDKSKYNDGDYYAVLMTVFKMIINKRHNLKENVTKDSKFKYYIISSDIFNYEKV